MPCQMGLRWYVRCQARILIGQSRSPPPNWNGIRMNKVATSVQGSTSPKLLDAQQFSCLSLQVQSG
jgi:hypothetical protein